MWGGAGGCSHGGCSSSSSSFSISSYGYGGGYGSGYVGGQGRSRGPGGSTSRKTFPPPHGADPQLWSWFIDCAADKDRPAAISTNGLKKALIKGDWTPFDLDTVKLLMNIFDVHRCDAILFNEFTSLWKYIKDWQGVFLHFDRDRSGTIDGNELQAALNQLGYKHTPDLLNSLQRKYDVKWSTPPAGGDQAAPPGITFDRFVRACVVAKQITESPAALDTDRDGLVQINN